MGTLIALVMGLWVGFVIGLFVAALCVNAHAADAHGKPLTWK